jgi:hypothetical protein
MAAAYWGRTSEESFVDHAGIPSISEQGNRTRDQLFLSSLSDRLIFLVWEVCLSTNAHDSEEVKLST